MYLFCAGFTDRKLTPPSTSQSYNISTLSHFGAWHKQEIFDQECSLHILYILYRFVWPKLIKPQKNSNNLLTHNLI